MPPPSVLTSLGFDETAAVYEWRLQFLEHAGIGYVHACALALAPDVDIHQAADLARAGCPDDLLVGILT